MLNVPLYNALVRKFVDVDVSKEDEQGEFEVPQITRESFVDGASKRKDRTYAHVTYWGECYKMNCPDCGDTRQRLYISHMWGQSVRRKKLLIMFGKKLYVCHNEHCNVDTFLRELVIYKKETAPDGYLEGYVGPKMKPGASRRAVLLQSIDLPTGSMSLLGDEVPDRVYAYLLGRGFAPRNRHGTGIATKYHLYYAPKGSTYMDGEEEREFYEDRLVIPIINRNRVVSWQARVFREKSKLKYLNAPGLPKTGFLYNMDVAWQYRDVVLVEGVTDVWRVGDNAVSPFGKTLSRQQARIMKHLWGHCGRLLIVLDRDARGGVDRNGNKLRDYAKDAKKLLDKEEAFPRGVFFYDLPDDRDPADYETREIRSMLQQEFRRLENLERANAQHLVLQQQAANATIAVLNPRELEDFE